MGFQEFVTERLAAITAQLNAISTNAKKIFELPAQSTLDPSSKIHVSRDGVSESLSLQKIIDAIINKTFSHLLEIGDITVTGLTVSVPSGAKWVYESVIYQTTAISTITETLCAAGHLRKDILVANQSNQIVLIKGDESETIRVLPNVPLGTILVSEIDVDDAVIGTPTIPVTIQELTNKLDKDTYTGNATDLDNRIIDLENPDTVLKEGEITVDGLDISILANDFQWQLNQVKFLVTPAFSTTLTAATGGFKRTDLLEGDNAGNYFIHQGIEGEFAAPTPEVTAGRIRLAAIPIFGATIGTPAVNGQGPKKTPTDQPFSVYKEWESGISLYKDKISIWKYIGVASKYINIHWDNLTNIFDIQFPNKTAGTIQTFAMISDVETSATTLQGNIDNKLEISDYNQHFKGVYATLAALNTALPTGVAGDYAQVNEVGATDVVNYSWDVEDSVWVAGGGTGGAANTDALPEGSTNLYWTVARFLANLTAANIKAALGISVLSGSNTGDQDLSGKQDTLISATNIKTVNGNSLLGSGDITVGGTGSTNLAYTPSSTNGIVTSDTGTDATVPLADATNAGLLKPAKYTVLENTSGTNTGDQDLSGKANIASPTFTGTPVAPTATVGTNTTQLATTAFVQESKVLPVTETGASFSLTDAYNGKITILTTSCTVTIPNGLIAGFEHTIVTLAGVTLTIALGGSVTLFNNAGTTMAEKLSCTIKNRTATNQYVTAGSL